MTTNPIMRGTTPKNIFTIPFSTALIKDLRISYGQNHKELFVKDIYDCELVGNSITVCLSQEDTLKLNCGLRLEIQVRVLTEGNEVLTSEIIVVDVGRCLNDEVLV